MYEIPSLEVKEASRVFGEVALLDKKAFDVSIDPANVLGALTGGYVAKRHYDKQVLDQQARQMRRQERQEGLGIEDDAFSQMQQLVQHLKIVFTPINVIYSVNNQTFEIIRTEEMTPMMKQAFREKDSAFFRDLLINKMNMELQLVQHALAQNVLKQKGGFQQMAQALDALDEDTFEKQASVVKAATAHVGEITYSLNLDSIRPFTHHEFFTDKRRFEKVASMFDHDVLNAQDLKGKVDVGFLPDRVVYLLNGQMIEQLPLVAMNMEGIEAFRARDRRFFEQFYQTFTQQQEVSDLQEAMPKQASDMQEVVAENLDNVLAITPIRSKFRFFEDADIHPLVYHKVFETRYPNWQEQSLEALITQIENDFKTSVSQIVFDKIAFLRTILNPEQSIFMSDFTYEKFVRAMNGKVVDFTQMQGGIELADLSFANDIAAILTDGENFLAFDNSLIEYTVNQITDEGVRSMSPLVYVADTEDETNYYRLINGLLDRVWSEADQDEDETFRQSIGRYCYTFVHDESEHIDLYDVEGSIDALLPKAPERLRRAVSLHVGSTADAIEKLEVMRRMMIEQLDAFENDWGSTK